MKSFKSRTTTKSVCIFVLFSVNTNQIIVYRTRLVIQIQGNVVGWWRRKGYKRQPALKNYSVSGWQMLSLRVILAQCGATHLSDERTLKSILNLCIWWATSESF